MCHTVRKITIWILMLDKNPQMLVFNGEILFSHSVPFLEQIWDHFMMWLHHHIITSKNCNCRTVWQRSSTVQCDIGPSWYLGIIVNILWVEKYLCTTILDEFHLFFIFEKSQTVIFQQCRTVWHAVFSWLSYYWTRKPGRWHGMFLVIVLT